MKIPWHFPHDPAHKVIRGRLSEEQEKSGRMRVRLWLPRDQPQKVSPLFPQPPGQVTLPADTPGPVHSRDNVNTGAH